MGYFCVKLLNGNIGHPFFDQINLTAQQTDIILLHVFQPTIQDGCTERSSNTGTNKAQHTQSLKKMFERYSLGYINGQRNIQNTMSQSF